ARLFAVGDGVVIVRLVFWARRGWWRRACHGVHHGSQRPSVTVLARCYGCTTVAPHRGPRSPNSGPARVPTTAPARTLCRPPPRRARRVAWRAPPCPAPGSAMPGPAPGAATAPARPLPAPRVPLRGPPAPPPSP